MPQDTECHKTKKNAPFSLPKVLVAVGSNMPGIADSPYNAVQAALRRLGDSPVIAVFPSRLFSTPCFPAGAGPDYVNAAAVLSGPRDAHEILGLLHRIEAEFDRQRETRWGSRTLDLDLIGVDDLVLPDLATWRHWHDLAPEDQQQAAPDRLILPHPRLQDRAFVLVPLLDVAPDWRHPILGLTVSEMVANLDPRDTAQIRPTGA